MLTIILHLIAAVPETVAIMHRSLAAYNNATDNAARLNAILVGLEEIAAEIRTLLQ